MTKNIEKLWLEFFSDECAKIETEEERALVKKSAQMHEKLESVLNENQSAALEKYVDSIYESEAAFIKKAFFKGAEFTLSFIYEAVNFAKRNE